MMKRFDLILWSRVQSGLELSARIKIHHVIIIMITIISIIIIT